MGAREHLDDENGDLVAGDSNEDDDTLEEDDSLEGCYLGEEVVVVSVLDYV